MACLVDTGVLLRAFDASNAHYRTIRRGLRSLWNADDRVAVALQNVAEFWNVSTRPIDNNGYGLSHERVHRRLTRIERFCEIIFEDEQSYHLWKDLLTTLFGHRDSRARCASRVSHACTRHFDNRHAQRARLSPIPGDHGHHAGSSLMPLAPPIEFVEARKERLSRPTPAVVEAMRQIKGDLLVLGASGKMGPSRAHAVGDQRFTH